MARTLAIGDVHGCSSALDTLLGFVRPGPRDTVVFLGDYVDRGPDTKGVLDRLIRMHLSGQVVCLRGNHEVMMSAAATGSDDFRVWQTCGGREALESYGRGDRIVTLDDIPAAHWRFMEKALVDWYETEGHVFVHANLHPRLPLAEQSLEWLHWQSVDPRWHRPHLSGKTMVCGHTEQRTGVPLVLDRAVCIDTWAYGDGWLTCLDVETGEYWQASELGELREDRLK